MAARIPSLLGLSPCGTRRMPCTWLRKQSSVPHWAREARPCSLTALLEQKEAAWPCQHSFHGPSRRTFVTSRTRKQSDKSVSEGLRMVMRSSAQPVAIVTTYLSDTKGSEAKEPSSTSRLVHGATLSSLTSVSLDPPLVAFSMRTPSRLAASLLAFREEYKQKEGDQAHFVISILSETQDAIAKSYATPGLEPYDHSSPSNSSQETDLDAADGDDQAIHPLQVNEIVPSHYADGVPYLADSVAALSCRLVGTLDLRPQTEGEAQETVRWSPGSSASNSITLSPGKPGSILFLAQVVGVDKTPDESARPLVYWQRKFTQLLS